MIDTSAVLSSGSALVTALRGLAATADALSKADLKGRILDAQGQALELQEKFFTLVRENDELREDREFKKTITFKDGMYWSSRPENPGPFCPTCYGKTGKAIPMLEKVGLVGRWCGACKTHVVESGTGPNLPWSSPAPEPAFRRDQEF